MSILLSTYWTEGIVFSADRNATIIYRSQKQKQLKQCVDVGSATKVLAWPRKTAVVGFIGLGSLAGLSMDEWIRQFIVSTRDYDGIDSLARQLRDSIQKDWDYDHPSSKDISLAGLIVHLGGFRSDQNVVVPAMYLITNVPGLKERGGYPDPTTDFTVSDQIAGHMTNWGVTYPSGVRDKIAQIEQRGDLLWFNNGYMYRAFNVFKGALWQALRVLRTEAMLEPNPTMKDRIAFTEMAVRVFGLFFEHHFVPEQRAVGGGADTEWIPWPG